MHSLGDEDTIPHPGPDKGYNQEQSEQPELWEASFVLSREWGAPQFTPKDVMD